MRQMQRKAVVWIGRLAMFFGLLLVMNMTAHAQFEENVYQKSGIPYIDLVWDEVTATMYTTQKFVEADTKRVTASTTSLSEGWYVVEGEVMAASRITVSGTVHLILCDGADFQVEDGIQVHDGSSLYLYAQSEGTDMGMLKADGDEYQAGIGGGYREAGGKIIINGGAVTARGGEYGAGIGGGYERAGGSITINGGEIVASGEGGGAGIGGGDGGDRGSITINGGVVAATAEGSHSGAGAGIGGGSGSYEDEGNITINGGVVIARCGGLSGGAGIGASNYRAAGSVSIHGGEVSGTGAYGAAGISGAEGSIIITGGRVTATGYSDPYDGGGDGIRVYGGSITINGGVVIAESEGQYGGAGINVSDGSLTITGGEVKATGGNGGAGIGGGDDDDGGSITITGGEIIATGGSSGAGIGGGSRRAGGNITITGGRITATGGSSGAGIGGGVFGAVGDIIISDGEVTATGQSGGAGIGSGYFGDGGSITIHGGKVTAIGGMYGAGIGVGEGGDNYNSNRGSIVITGGEVSAAGGLQGAGIGGGSHRPGGNITIHGGVITASGGGEGAGIGGGNYGSGGNIVISGGNIYTVGGIGASDIGSGANESGGSLTDGEGNAVYLNTITLPQAQEHTAVTGIAGVTYGIKDVATLHTNKLYFYLPAGVSASSITTGGVEYICNRNLTYDTEHAYKDATCAEPKTCFYCGHRVGAVIDHNYVDGSCTTCGMDRNGHFHIRTEDQLMAFAAHVNQGRYDADATLMADLDLSGYPWKPIAGTAVGDEVTEGYTGNFDGNGYTIRNVSFDHLAVHTTAGIFGTVQSGGTVTRLGVENLSFQRSDTIECCVGGIAGQLMSGGTIRDCYVTDSAIQVTEGAAGGIAGRNRGTVENCFTAGLTLEGIGQKSGGIAGDCEGGSIVNCYTSHAEIGGTDSSVESVTGSEAGITAERFATGEITYKLNGTETGHDLIWYQTIGTNPYPAFWGSIVYQTAVDGSYGNERHDHVWVYTTEGTGTLQAHCDTDRCIFKNNSGGSVSIAAPADAIYTGRAIEAIVTGTLTTGDTVTVVYTGEGLVNGLPVKAGTYTAKIILGGQEIGVTYIIGTVASCPKDRTCLMYSYKDLDLEKWYHDGIHYCIVQGMMQGVGQNLFRPDGTTTRAMCVTILWRLEGSPVVNHAMNFSDVSTGKWYTEAIRWAASQKIVEGYSNGSFGTEDNITREQMAAILYRYEKSRGGGFPNGWTFTMDYVDRNQVSAWAYESMCWMNMNKIINGRPGKVLDPKGNATRAETAAILQRYCGVAAR